MKILFVAVFEHGSTNVSQSRALKRCGADVHEFNYRKLSSQLGIHQRDILLMNVVSSIRPDVVLLSKGTTISNLILKECKNTSKLAMWYMDPVTSITREIIDKCMLSNIVFCDKENSLELLKNVNNKSHWICEGFDPDTDFATDTNQNIDVGFIGNIYGVREKLLDGIDCKITNNAYGRDHAELVSRTKININICTAAGASDRVYKTMAAGGFLLTNDWKGRKDIFTEEHMRFFESKEELVSSINYYLANPDVRATIAQNGHSEVQKYSRNKWASRIIELIKACH
jgi:hypothetical protein